MNRVRLGNNGVRIVKAKTNASNQPRLTLSNRTLVVHPPIALQMLNSSKKQQTYNAIFVGFVKVLTWF